MLPKYDTYITETKLDGEPIINLPPKYIKMKTVKFTAEERSFYAQLEAESRSQFKVHFLFSMMFPRSLIVVFC